MKCFLRLLGSESKSLQESGLTREEGGALNWTGLIIRLGGRRRGRGVRERVCLACEWRRRCRGDRWSRGTHGRAVSPSSALWEHHWFGPCCRGSQLSKGGYRGGEGGGGERGGRSRGQRAPRLTLSWAERWGHVTGWRGAALKRVGVWGAALAVPKQTGVEWTGWLWSSSSTAAAPHAFELFQCVQDYVGGVSMFRCILSLHLTELA